MITLCADKGYDPRCEVRSGAVIGVVPQVVRKTSSRRLVVVASVGSYCTYSRLYHLGAKAKAKAKAHQARVGSGKNGRLNSSGIDARIGASRLGVHADNGCVKIDASAYAGTDLSATAING